MKNLLKIAKRVTSKSIYNKLKRIKNEEELRGATRYAIVSVLKGEYQDMEIEIKRLEGEMKDVFFARNKLIRIPSKISHFQVSFDEGEFDNLVQSFKSVRGEIGNV